MIRRNGLLIGLLLVCASACAMEDETKGSGPPAPPPAPEPSVWQQLKDTAIWVVSPFEVVDANDEVKAAYGQEIRTDWDTITKKPKEFHGWDEPRKKAAMYRRDKLQPIKDHSDAVPNRDQILIYKYGYKCIFVRPLLGFVHGSSYHSSRIASALYYGALVAGGVKAAQKMKEWWRQLKESKDQEDVDSVSSESAQDVVDTAKSGVAKKCAQTTHDTCEWCVARKNETNIHNQIVEESL